MARPSGARRSPWRFGVPVVCLLAGPAAGGHPRGVRRRRDPPQRRAPAGRPGAARRRRVGRPPQRPTGRAGRPGRRHPRQVVRPGAGGHAGPGRRAGRATPAWTRCTGRAWRSPSPTPSATPTDDSPATPPPTTWWSTSRTSRPSSTRCGVPVPRPIQMQDQRIIATSAPRCVGNTLLLNGRTYSPPYTDRWRSATSPAMQAALAAAPLVTLYKQYVVRFGLGYTEEARSDVEIVGYTEPVRMRYAQPAGPDRVLTAGSLCTMRVLVVDNYDSFVFNLVQYLGQLGVAARGLAQRRRTARLRRPDRAGGRATSTVCCSAPDRAHRNAPAPPSALVRACAAAGTPLLGVCLGPPGDRRGVRCHRRPRTRAAARQDQHACSTRMSVCCKGFRIRSPRPATTR